MNDREFDMLLSESLRTYGHEYQHGADGPLETGPAPVHQFPDNFLDDVFPQEKKKPLILRLMPYIAATAALFVITVAVVLAAQFGSSSSSDSLFIGSIDKSGSSAQKGTDNTPSAVSGLSHDTVNSTRNSEASDHTDPGTSASAPSYEPDQSYYHDADPDFEAKEDIYPSDDDKAGQSLNYKGEIAYNGSSQTLSGPECEALLGASAPIMNETEACTSPLPDDDSNVIFSASISPEEYGQTLSINGINCRTLSIRMTENNLILTAGTESGQINYLFTAQNSYYNYFAQLCNSLFG